MIVGESASLAPPFTGSLKCGCFAWHANAISGEFILLSKVARRLALEVATVELIEHPFGGTLRQARQVVASRSRRAPNRRKSMFHPAELYDQRATPIRVVLVVLEAC